MLSLCWAQLYGKHALLDDSVLGVYLVCIGHLLRVIARGLHPGNAVRAL